MKNLKTTKLTYIFLAFLFSVSFSNCTKDKLEDPTEYLVEIDGVFLLSTLDSPPHYLDGGLEGFTLNLLENIDFPDLARQNGTSGTAIVSYIVETDGTVQEIEIIQDPGDGIGEALKSAVEVTVDGVAFMPALLNGELVRVKLSQKATFSL